MVFEEIHKSGGHEQVVFCHDKNTSLRAIIAIHDTTLGPALGGTRMWNYASEEEALVDVLRLSEGMTYKASAAGLNLGGGKAVIIGDPKVDKSEILFRSFGQYVHTLNGRYITAEDVGTNVGDMGYVYMETPWVTGIPERLGGSGDPSPYTAHGVLMGIKSSCREKLGTDELSGVRVVVQGLGRVGASLVGYLLDEGAEVSISDIDPRKVEALSGLSYSRVLNPGEALSTECEVYSPCALGATINSKTLSSLKCQIVAGGANNQLETPEQGESLREMGILYAPDFVINSGGLMSVFGELEGSSLEGGFDKTSTLYDSLSRIFDQSKKEDISTVEAAYRLARERLQAMSHLKKKRQGWNFSTNTVPRSLAKR